MDQRVSACCDHDQSDTVDVDSVGALITSFVSTIPDAAYMPLRKAAGRILSRNVYSGMALPPFDHSAVDGFGFRSADVGEGSTGLPVTGRILAGDRPSRLRKHTAVRLMTGAPVPAGCDAVLKQESASITDGHLTVTGQVLSGTNIRRVGEDVRCGELLVPGGTVLDARHIALLSACGTRSVRVARRVRIIVAAFGNELRKPGSTLRPGQIFDSNTPMAEAFLRRPWTRIVECVRIGDNPGRAAELLRDLSADADLIVTSGGMAHGDEDHTRVALEQAGGTWQPLALRMKPGKPSGLGRIGTTFILGLPGNPFAALVGLTVLGIPLLSALSGASLTPEWLPARAAFALRRRPGRTEFFPARLSGFEEDSALRIERLGKGGSARLQPLVDAGGLARLEASVEVVSPGDRLTFLPFPQLLA